MTAHENGPLGVWRRLRYRWWLAGGAVVVAVAVTVVLITVTGSDLMTPDRVVTGGETSLGDDSLRDVQFDDATGTAYFTYVANGQRRLAAYKEGSSEPLWIVDAPGIFSSTGDGLVLTWAERSLSALDARTGQRLWTQSSLPLSGGSIHSSGHVFVSLLDKDGLVDGVAVLDARTGELTWKLEHDGRDRVMTIPGTNDMLHYVNGRELRRLELATGRELMSADISAQASGATNTTMTFAGDSVLLSMDRGQPAMGGTSKGVVVALADLTVRWEHEGRVTSLSDDLFYAGSSETGRQVLDAQGRELWRPEEEVQVGRQGATWGYIRSSGGPGGELPPETNRFTYVDLRTGNRLAGDSREQAWFGKAGVLQVFRAREPQFWFLSLPDSDTTSLGDLPVAWPDCAFSHTYIACFDNDGKPGIWRYRD